MANRCSTLIRITYYTCIVLVCDINAGILQHFAAEQTIADGDSTAHYDTYDATVHS